MIKNMTVSTSAPWESDDSTRAGCRLALNACFITVSDRCGLNPSAALRRRSCWRGASSQWSNVGQRQAKTPFKCINFSCFVFIQKNQFSRTAAISYRSSIGTETVQPKPSKEPQSLNVHVCACTFAVIKQENYFRWSCCRIQCEHRVTRI